MPLKRLEEVAVILHPADNVAVLKRPVRAGEELSFGAEVLRVSTAIGAGHKVALETIPDGASVRKYGQVIGFAKGPIESGAHVHTHNVVISAFDRDYQYCTEAKPVSYYPSEKRHFFQGYARPDGRVGTRNYIAVISSVNCSASVSNYVRDRFRTGQFRQAFTNAGAVIAFTHKGGCGLDPGEPQTVLQRVLAGIARHPNISGYVMIGLGCEVNQLESIRKAQHLDQQPEGHSGPVFMNIQAKGGVRKTV